MNHEHEPRRNRFADLDLGGVGDLIELAWHVLKFLVRIMLEIFTAL